MKWCSVSLLVLLVVCGITQCVHLEFDPKDPLQIQVNDCVSVLLRQTRSENTSASMFVEIKSVFDIVEVSPTSLPKQAENTTWSHTIEICALDGGHTLIKAKALEPPSNKTKQIAYLPVVVYNVRMLKLISDVSGWVYFLSWSISYYPQIYTNYSRKSVVGLNFDFATLNIIGFFLYSIYNCAMYFSSSIKRSYFHSHPKGMNPVMLNDVIFSLHAFFATSVIIYQCCVYERGTQRVSWVAKIIITLYIFIVITSAVLAQMEVLTWLDFILYCSYVKLTVTMIKYIPQAIMNYTRKSTVGWSIENVLLDFIGGIFSMLQMIINGYNYHDWDSIFGDPTKFGLGMFSAMFDIFFMYQHYVLYRCPYEEQVDEIAEPPQPSVESQVHVNDNERDTSSAQTPS